MKNISIYIHIPFCIQKCAYCDFLSAPADSFTKKAYVDALCQEIKAWEVFGREYEVDTIFFGGGTPSCLESGLLEQILCELKEGFHIAENAEITVEVNPGTVDITKLKGYVEAGVNRLSIGLQSANNQELKLLGRIHSYEDFMLTYNGAREVGIQNINVDLMSALPGQTEQDFIESLHKVIALNPEHISAYSLIIEEGTPFFDIYVNHEELLPSEEEERRIYEKTGEILEQNGYHRYEISNYSKEGYHSRHNSVYWQGGEYLGLGLGASSMVLQTRFKGIDILKEYIDFWSGYFNGGKRKCIEKVSGDASVVKVDRIIRQKAVACELTGENIDSLGECVCDQIKGLLCAYQEIEVLSKENRMSEFMFLGLRMMRGVSAHEFMDRFQISIEEIYGEPLQKFCREGFMEKVLTKGDYFYRLTKEGINVSNSLFVEFI